MTYAKNCEKFKKAWDSHIFELTRLKSTLDKKYWKALDEAIISLSDLVLLAALEMEEEQ